MRGTPHAVAVQPDGRILVDGYYQDVLGFQRYGVVRLNHDGSRDYTFNPGAGLAGGSSGPSVNAILILPGNQLLLGGYFSGYDGVPVQGMARLDNPPILQIVPFVERRIQGTLVQLTASPLTHVAAYEVEDHPPAEVVNISHGGIWDSIGCKVTFGPFQDHEPRTLSYTGLMLPDGNCHRPQAIWGTATADQVTVPITGQSVFNLDEVFPADLCPADGIINDVELERYVSAWVTGRAWPQGPNPIPIDYATRIGALWRAKDSYGFDPFTITNHPTLHWLPFGAGFPVCLVYPSPLPTGRAERQLPGHYVPGRPMTISLTVTPADNVQVYAVEEQLPVGWTAHSESLGDRGYWDSANRKVKWGPFYDHTARTLSYVVVPSTDASQEVQFTGTASFEGVNIAASGSETIAPALSLIVFRWTAEGGVLLRLVGGGGARVRIEYSSDLLDWEMLAEFTNTSRAVDFSDPAVPGIAHRFYRARRLE